MYNESGCEEALSKIVSLVAPGQARLTEMLCWKSLCHNDGGICWTAGLSLGLLGWLSFSACAPAAEPFEKFLARMREEKQFELALLYLEDIEKRPDVDKEFKQVIDLERALLYSQSASFLPRSSAQRVEQLNQTETALNRFVESQLEHPRRSEARLKLGGLLQLRAEEALTKTGVDGQQDIAEAVQFYDQAHQLYESIIAELVDKEASLRGGRTDTTDPKQVANRDRVISELREAQLLSARSVENRGRSRANSNPDRVADLQQAKKMFTELYNKEKSLIAIRSFALFYRSGIYQSLGQPDDAIDGYQRIVDLENIDVLRPLQTEAVTELSKVLAAEGKYELAIERATRWLDGLQNVEKASSEGMSLGLELAKIRIDYLEKLRADDPNDRNIVRMSREVRDFLRAMLRTPGPYQDRIKALMGKLGVDGPDSDTQNAKLPVVKNLTEALSECQARIDDADSLGSNLDTLNERLKSGQLLPDEVPAVEQQRDEVQQRVDGLYQQALTLIRNGLDLFNRDSDDRTELNKARRHLAYLLLQLKQPQEAIVIGEFLSRTAPATPQGLNAARIVLNGYSELIQDGKNDQLRLLKELAPFAEFLVVNWPQSSEAASVSSALTQMAVLSKDWESAERYLQIVPDSDPAIASHYFQLGAALFDQYQGLQKQVSPDPHELDALRERAIKWLRLSAQKVDPQNWNLQLGVNNALALLLLSKDQVDEADQALISGDTAPLHWLSSKVDQVSQDSALDACRTAIRIVAAKVALRGMNASEAAQSMQSFVNLLQSIAARTVDGQKKLQSIFASIARDMKEKLSLIKEPEKRTQVAEVVLLVLSEAAKSDSFSTQYWAASSILSIADQLSSKAAFQAAIDLLSKMNQTATQQPQWAQPDGAQLQLRIMLARAAEGTEDFRTALLTYGQILDDNENLLDAQISVARLLQKMGSENPTRLNNAILGGRPRPKTGKNVFWGWGKISQVTARKMENYSQQFFESRYQLANCRWMLASSLTDASAKNAELARAERALNETYSLYPALGGPDDVQRFEALLKKIQQELGKTPAGFG